MKVRYKLRNCYTSEPSSLVAQMIQRLPTMWETQIQSLGQEDLLEKEMATHSSILAWKIPWTEEPDRLQSIGSQSVGHDWLTSLSLSTHLKDSTTEKHSHRWQEKEWRWKGIVGGETLRVHPLWQSRQPPPGARILILTSGNEASSSFTCIKKHSYSTYGCSQRLPGSVRPRMAWDKSMKKWEEAGCLQEARPEHSRTGWKLD